MTLLANSGDDQEFREYYQELCETAKCDSAIGLDVTAFGNVISADEDDIRMRTSAYVVLPLKWRTDDLFYALFVFIALDFVFVKARGN